MVTSIFFDLESITESIIHFSYTPYYVAPEILSNDKYDKVINQKEK